MYLIYHCLFLGSSPVSSPPHTQMGASENSIFPCLAVICRNAFVRPLRRGPPAPPSNLPIIVRGRERVTAGERASHTSSLSNLQSRAGGLGTSGDRFQEVEVVSVTCGRQQTTSNQTDRMICYFK